MDATEEAAFYTCMQSNNNVAIGLDAELVKPLLEHLFDPIVQQVFNCYSPTPNNPDTLPCFMSA